MKRLFVTGLAEGKLVLAGDDFHYLSRVLRVESGEIVTLFGEGREAEARVARVGDAEIEVEVAAPRRAPAGPEIVLLIGLLKGEKMDWVVQKATELGAMRIVPLATRHAVVRAPGAGKTGRWQRIAREAARQSERADVPVVDEVHDFAAGLATPGGWRVLFHQDERGRRLRSPAGDLGPVVIAVGPEGGFAPDEVEAARAAGFDIAGLGPRVLRAETAALAALAQIALLLG